MCAGGSTSLAPLCSPQPSFLTGRSVHWPFKCTLGGRERKGREEGGRERVSRENVRRERRPPPARRSATAAGRGRPEGRGRGGGDWRGEGESSLMALPCLLPPSFPPSLSGCSWAATGGRWRTPASLFPTDFQTVKGAGPWVICETGQLSEKTRDFIS